MNDSNQKDLIGIMSVVHEGRFPFGKQTYFFEDMVRYSEVDAHRLFFFSPLEWKSESAQVMGYKFVNGIWKSARETLPIIIYDRAFSKDETQKLQIENFRKFLSDSKTTLLNSFDLTNLLNDKVAFHAFLMSHQIPTLGTLPFTSINKKEFHQKKNGNWYIKPTFGSKGEGIFVIEKRKDSYRLFDHLGSQNVFSSFADLEIALNNQIVDSHRYFIQEAAHIPLVNTAPFDIRVLVQHTGSGYIVSGKAVRVGQKKAKTSNLNAGGNAFPFAEMQDFWRTKCSISTTDLEAKIDQLCLDCSVALRQEFGDFCEIGFDVLVTLDQGPIIIEGNAKPSRWVFVKMADYLESLGKDNSYYLNKRKETVRIPIQYALHLMQQNR